MTRQRDRYGDEDLELDDDEVQDQELEDDDLDDELEEDEGQGPGGTCRDCGEEIDSLGFCSCDIDDELEDDD